MAKPYTPRAERSYSYTIGDQDMGPTKHQRREARKAQKAARSRSRGYFTEEEHARIKQKIRAERERAAASSPHAQREQEHQRTLDATGPSARDPFPHVDAIKFHREMAEKEPHRRDHHLRQMEEHKSLYHLKLANDFDRTTHAMNKCVAQQPAAKAPEAPKAAMTGARGGKYVIGPGGKKRYLGKKAR